MSEISLKICKGGDLGVNSYILMSKDSAIVIDPGDFKQIAKVLQGKRLEYIIITHEHFDHIFALNELRDLFGAKVIAQRMASQNITTSSKNLSRFSDMIYDVMKVAKRQNIVEFNAQKADIEFDESYELLWQDHTLLLTHTPGHTEGSCCIRVDRWLFCGDSLFEATQTSFLGGSKAKARYDEISLPFFRSLDPDLHVYAGHGESFILGDKLNAIQRAIEIFKNRPKFTNLFVSFDEFNKIINEAQILVRGNNCFLLIKHNGFYKFYYLVDSLANLKNLDAFFRLINEPIITEIVSKEAIKSDFFCDIGFKDYKIYSRYKSTKKNRSFKNVQNATLDDIDEILELINKTFDPLSDYLPNFDELKELILKQAVFVVRLENVVAGVAIYELKQKICYFRLNCVRQDFQNGLIGYALASAPEQMQEAQVFYAWMHDENSEAIRLNQALGYKPDGLKDYIFIKKDNG